MQRPLSSAGRQGDSFAPADARAVLSTSPAAGDWKVWRARSGWSQRTFVAVDGRRRIFLKFGAEVDALRRLAELAVTPAVLHSGEYRGHSFVIQAFIGGRHPHHGWFGRHLPELASLVGAYQRDARLRALVSPTTTLTHRGLVTGVLDDLELRSRRGITPPQDGQLLEAIGHLRRLSTNLPSAELVPTHGDPNPKNFILTDDLYLVDWDDLALSDPFRDVGQLLWWYVPRNRWHDFFELFGFDEGPHARDGLYWWVAAESLDVAMKVAERGDPGRAKEFLADFAAAIEQRANPHAAW
jgi:Phosphotransferase enzyme family